MRKLFICLFLTFEIYCANAQTGVFKTYQDYLSGNIEKMNDDVNVKGTSLGLSYHFELPDGSDVKYKAKNFWGFLYKGYLFRSNGSYTAMLQDSGKVCYYISGEAGVKIIRTGKDYGVTIVGPYCFLSSGDFSTDLYSMPRNGFDQKGLRKFKNDFSQFEDLFECIGNFSNCENLSKCVQEFNIKKKK